MTSRPRAEKQDDAGVKVSAVELDSLISACEVRQAGVSWPLPVDHKLDRMLAEARAVTERTSRREIVAALIALSDLDGDGVSDLVRRYRRTRVQDIAGPGNPGDVDNVLKFEHKKSGPRPMRTERR
jgi:hypothetical protein